MVIAETVALLALGGEEAEVVDASVEEVEDDELLKLQKERMQLRIKKQTSRGANFPSAKVMRVCVCVCVCVINHVSVCFITLLYSDRKQYETKTMTN